jgi:branched-chain amino acid aminotransferase
MSNAQQFREWIYFNGTWHEGEIPIASSSLHALWMASSVFDGARWFDGVAPDLLLHCRRLNASAVGLGLKPLLEAEQIADIAWQGLRKFAKDVPIYIKPTYFATRGTAQWVPPDPESTVFMLSLKEAPFSKSPGASLTVSPFRRPTAETMPTDAKAGCLYPNGARALTEAASRGFDNALMLDMLGNVAETATSNIFIVKSGEVLTPALNGTFLPGITRARVIELLVKDGIKVRETRLTVADFHAADEIFTTGNMLKVFPVLRFEDRQVPEGPITRRARELYFQWAKSHASN